MASPGSAAETKGEVDLPPRPPATYTPSLSGAGMAWYQPDAKLVTPEAAPGPRAAHSCNLMNNRLHVFGGWNGKKGLNDMHILDLERMEWSVPPIAGVFPSTRNNHATFAVGSKLYVHGGHDGSKWLADLHLLDTESMEWSIPAIAGSAPSARACHTTTLLNRKLYMFGGYDGTKCFNDLDVLDIDTMTWILPRVSGTVPQARNAQTVTVVGLKLFLFGGHSGNKHLHDLHVLDTESMSWSSLEVTGQLPPGLRGHTATYIGNKIFLFGGYDGRGRSNDLYLFNTNTLVWEHPPSNELTPAGRQRHTACLVGSKKLFVLGGFDGFKWLNDLHVLDVGKLEESAITTAAVRGLLTDLRALINNPDSFPDVQFIVDGKKVYAHRAMLAVRADHYRAMFTSGMKESHGGEIEIKDWSYTAFVSMLEFLYTGTVQVLPAELAVEVMGLADQIGLDALKALCESTLIQNVDTDNVCTLFSTAHRYMARALKAHCMDFILKNSTEIPLEPLSEEPTLLLEITRESMKRQRG